MTEDPDDDPPDNDVDNYDIADAIDAHHDPDDDPGHSDQADPDDHQHPDPLVLGDPDESAQHWHRQEEPTSCAVAAQEFVLDELTGVDHSEAELRAVAAEHGWYDPENGTSMENTGKLLEYYGIPTEHHRDAQLADLESALAEGDSVIVGVDSSEIWNPETATDDSLADHIGIPGQGADHAVQVIGIDHRDPSGPVIVLNDPGDPAGRGARIPLETFLLAWEDSDNFLVTAHRP